MSPAHPKMPKCARLCHTFWWGWAAQGEIAELHCSIKSRHCKRPCGVH